MQYEIYEQTIYNEHKLMSFLFESDDLVAISSYIENFPVDKSSKTIILNNCPTKPIAYFQLGFDKIPTEEEYYDTIFNCKLAKERHYQFKESNSYNINLNSKSITKIANNIFSVAKLQTEVYFKKYHKSK